MVRRHKYPKTRSAPVEHKVNSHTRDGKLIKSFTRGSGKRYQRAKKVVKGVGKKLKQIKDFTADEIEMVMKQRMLDRCFKGTRAERFSARAALKEYYPDFYEECKFTKGFDRRRKSPRITVIRPTWRDQFKDW